MFFKSVSKYQAKSLSQLVFQLAPQIVICSIIIILIATLFPFNFTFENGFSLAAIIGKFKQTSTFLSDQIKNLFLFLPLGFGLMCWLQKTQLKPILKLLLVVFFSFILSLTVEVLQAFLPSRESTYADIFNNTFSGFLGCLCFYLWNFKIISNISNIIDKNKKSFSSKQLTAIFTIYIAIAFLIPIPWQSITNLSNWDLNTPLLLGNEKTGNRPWEGFISEVYIADRAISKEEVAKVFANKNKLNSIGSSLIAHYQFNGIGEYSDRTGNLPNLIWRGQPASNYDKRGVFLSEHHWLETADSVSYLNQRIREADSFTIGATVATADINQSDPARIISISSSTTKRNLTLEQRDSKLVVRLRTPLNGENALYIENYTFDVFTDTNPHQIVVTYAGSVLHTYIDKLENSHEFNFLEIIPKSDKILFYGIMFIPLGILLGIITTLSQGRLVLYPFLYTGILLPSLIVEIILARDSGRTINLANILLGILMTTVTVFVLRMQIPKELRRKLFRVSGE